jgi:hypothetical protein
LFNEETDEKVRWGDRKNEKTKELFGRFLKTMISTGKECLRTHEIMRYYWTYEVVVVSVN